MNMRIVFYGHDKDYKWHQHLAATISLSSGDQGIPNGFSFRSLCGAWSSSYQEELDLYSTTEVDCPECLRLLKEYK